MTFHPFQFLNETRIDTRNESHDDYFTLMNCHRKLRGLERRPIRAQGKTEEMDKRGGKHTFSNSLSLNDLVASSNNVKINPNP